MQEEPENMGAWGFVRPLIEELAEGRWPLCYVGRARSASPSEGTTAWHAVNQKILVERGVRAAPSAANPHGAVEEGVKQGPWVQWSMGLRQWQCVGDGHRRSATW